MSERYTVIVGDEMIEVEGQLTITEAFDFLSFFDRQGYNRLIACDGNCLTLYKMDFEKEKEIEQSDREKDLISTLNHKQRIIEQSELELNEQKDKTKQLESLIKELMSESSQTNLILRSEIDECEKKIRILEMEKDPRVKALLDCQDIEVPVENKFLRSHLDFPPDHIYSLLSKRITDEIIDKLYDSENYTSIHEES